MRALVLIPIAIFLASCQPETARPPEAHLAGATESPLAERLRIVVVNGSNYDSSQILVQTASAQVVVTVTNSNLLKGPAPARDADAELIAHNIEKFLAANPDGPTIIAIHVEYLEAPPASAPRVVASMDFRKDREGRFRKDVS